jgi:ABC-type spermidine/putrescine transport system permease subunit II
MFNVHWRNARHFLLWAFLVVPLLVIFVFSAAETETLTACIHQKTQSMPKTNFKKTAAFS